MEKVKILHFSPIRKESEIVKLHLESLVNLEKDELEITFSFYDDNLDSVSSLLIQDFANKYKNSIIWDFEVKKENNIPNERWYGEAYDRITIIKDKVIGEFVHSDFDFLFLTDADLILNPMTVQNLFEQQKDFISMIFWTKFEGSNTYFPNAWMNLNSLFYSMEEFLGLRSKIIKPVDFTGACTMLSKKIAIDGVRFKAIPQLKNSYKGEDKFFCIRAGVLGYQPYVSTFYPAFHLYNVNLITEGKKWVEDNYTYDYLLNNWLNKEWEIEIEDFINKSVYRKSRFSRIKKTIKKIIKK